MIHSPFSAVTLLVGRQEEPVKVVNGDDMTGALHVA